MSSHQWLRAFHQFFQSLHSHCILVRMKNDSPDEMSKNITQLLHRVSQGDKSVADQLTRTIERELRKIASIHMRRVGNNKTLQTTAVMDEAVARLLGTKGEGRRWNNRQHFFVIASRTM